MKYETPELTALTPAINAIQITGASSKQLNPAFPDSVSQVHNDASFGYADWED
jgi:hypothetical protein